MQLDVNFLEFQEYLQVKTQDGKRCLFDPLRKKWLVLQPEELVRQLIVQFFIKEMKYPHTRIKLEMGLHIHTIYKRCDILIYDQDVQPFMLVECKAPQIKLTEAVFRQAATYNLPLRVPYLMVSNGPESYACAMDYETETFTFLEKLPDFPRSF